jgi:NhaP-type Na+/H+ or K+/H+ antiporter
VAVGVGVRLVRRDRGDVALVDDPRPTCVTSSGTTLFIAVSLGFLLVGLITGIAAWRIRRRSAEASA